MWSLQPKIPELKSTRWKTINIILLLGQVTSENLSLGDLIKNQS